VHAILSPKTFLLRPGTFANEIKSHDSIPRELRNSKLFIERTNIRQAIKPLKGLEIESFLLLIYCREHLAICKRRQR